MEAGLITPVDGPDGRPRFRAGDIARLRTHATWPHRTLTPADTVHRERLVHALAETIDAAFAVRPRAHYSHRADAWTLDWAPDPDGRPTAADVAALLPPPLLRARSAGRLHLLGRTGQAMHWAWAMLQPGRAAVLDFETTSLTGVAVEVAVLDAATGEVLLDTLIHPADHRVTPGAFAKHGITDAMLKTAPGLDTVLPELLRVTCGRTVIAYKEEFDRTVLGRHSRLLGLDPQHLGQSESWACLMQQRSAWLATTSRLALNGPHRALGDVRASRELLNRMVTWPSTLPPTCPTS
ncbi:3'-5' exonuclease [Kitasatospora purpeofusca]|uniref:3'-5' exonuclease n=1 Tax=Kitasatospora purpeofusca TaxID=67352 RepID=UPI0035DF0CE9